jgi:hypothetical protein
MVLLSYTAFLLLGESSSLTLPVRQLSSYCQDTDADPRHGVVVDTPGPLYLFPLSTVLLG